MNASNDNQPSCSNRGSTEVEDSSAVDVTIGHDHTYATMHSPRTMKRKLDIICDTLEKSNKKLKVQQKKSSRLHKKVQSLNSLITTLQNENRISTHCAELLEKTLTGVPKELMERIARKKKVSAYPEELKAFAMTLQFYSSKAYNYVRESFGLAFPHPRQIGSWYKGVDGDPGFTRPAFAALEARATDNQAKGKETICAIMLDEMAIKKHVEFANGRYYGYADIGNGEFDDSTPVAKDVLVLMAVSVNEAWKIPLGYFLLDGMNGQERANLIEQCLHKLHDVNVRAVSLTCDGPSCHFTMLRHLGANMNVDSLDPSFPHPADSDQKVHVLLDICHMLKLLRNCFADGKVLQTEDGRLIKWEYIEELNNLQNREGLRLGNKLKNAHIMWRKQKMKVNLAAQVFSSSVADALEYCNKKLKMVQFQGCEATVEFLRYVDSAFDVLNSRNPLGKGFKAPMRKTNQERWQKILQEARKFLLGLQSQLGKPMYLGQRKTGFVGFVASIDSCMKLFSVLVDAPNSPMSYLLTYKFSQDHLELFFAAVRSCGGFNNNPTARQFQACYKRLLMRHNIKNGNGNCSIMDNTTILNIQYTTQSSISLAKKYDLVTRPPLESDHDYVDTPNYEEISQYKEAAVSYISGFVVRMMKKRIHCKPCISALTAEDETPHAFVELKNHGGLVKASPSVISVCTETEKCFQHMLKMSDGKLPQGDGITEAIVLAVFTNSAGLSLFQELHNHQFDTSIEDNHIHNLVKMASSCYSKIRLYHLGKAKTEELVGIRVRKQMSKLILFKHQ